MEFDPETFALTGLEITSGLLRTTTRLPIDRLVQFAADRVVVREAVRADLGGELGAPAAGS